MRDKLACSSTSSSRSLTDHITHHSRRVPAGRGPGAVEHWRAGGADPIPSAVDGRFQTSDLHEPPVCTAGHQPIMTDRRTERNGTARKQHGSIIVRGAAGGD